MTPRSAERATQGDGTATEVSHERAPLAAEPAVPRLIWSSFIDPIVFDRPHLARGSAWVSHVPFAFWIVKAARPRAMVELGTETGVSYFAFCQAVERLGLDTRCHAIDTWEGDEHTGYYGKQVFASVAEHNRRYEAFSALVRSTFDDSVGSFPDGSIDLLHIDGLHTYEAVSHDFQTWLPKLSQRAIVLVHDTNVRERQFGVSRFWREVAAHYRTFEFLHGSGLGVLVVGAEAPETVKALCDAQETSAQAVRATYARLGSALAIEFDLGDALERTRSHAASVSAELAAARTRTDELLGAVEQAIAAEEEQRVSRARQERVASANASRALAQERHAKAQERRAAEAEHALAQERAALDELRGSTWWRIGRPVRGTITRIRRLLGHRPRSDPTSTERPLHVRLVRPFVPLRARRAFRQRFPAPVTTPPTTRAGSASTEDILAKRFPSLRPFRVIPAPTSRRQRLTLITDSLSPGSLFGGVGTSLILASQLARRFGASLRVVTRTEQPDPSAVGTVLRAQNIDFDGNIEFLHSRLAPDGAGIPVQPDDVYLTTSWWGTWAALRSFDPSRIVYLLQEDERLFYPAGDDQLKCTEIFADERIRFVLNTSMLRDYLVREGFDNIGLRGIAFEPAFPSTTYYREPYSTGPRLFFFYGRPNNVRNLFARGLEAVTAAIREGVLLPHQWEFRFVGKDIPRVELPFGIVPSRSENLPWPEYAALVRRVDVGLSLMSSPHPSYPPLDLAACGAVAVTNRFGPKQDLSTYSANILCADLATDALVETISDAVALASDEERRKNNFATAGLSRSWEQSLAATLDVLADSL